MWPRKATAVSEEVGKTIYLTVVAAVAIVFVAWVAYIRGSEDTRRDWVQALHVTPPFVIDAARECTCTCKEKP